MSKRYINWQRNIMFFLLSQGITLFGSQIVQMAIVWYVTISTNSGVWVAAFSISSYLTHFLIPFVGGELSDRYHKKHLIISADLLIALTTLVMLLLIPYIEADRILIGALFVMSIVRSIGAGIQVPAVNAMTAQLLSSEEYTKYNGINVTIQSVVQFAAPAVAVFLITAWSLSSTLVVDIVTAAIGIGMLLRVRVEFQLNSNIERSTLQEVKEGVRYVCSNDAVRNMLMLYGIFLFMSVRRAICQDCM